MSGTDSPHTRDAVTMVFNDPISPPQGDLLHRGIVELFEEGRPGHACRHICVHNADDAPIRVNLDRDRKTPKLLDDHRFRLISNRHPPARAMRRIASLGISLISVD
ncbi:hypothetical protein D3C80_1605680 [compost metagenome]